MAMTMTGDVALPADRELVWKYLNDPDVLRSCIPGCLSLEKTSGTGFAAVVRLKVGPVGATFKGSVELSDIDPPNGYRITGQGEGGVAGFAKGGAHVRLSALENDARGCLLSYVVEANVGGKLAQLGARLIDGVAKKIAEQFFTNLATAIKNT